MGKELVLLKQHQDFYLKELKSVLSFWCEHGYDRENRGFFTYLDKNGKVYCEDKSVWAQGRGVYIFAKAYQSIERNEEWLQIAKDTYSFLQEKAFFDNNKMYFKITKEGKPLQIRRYWFSEAFYIMASISLYEVTGKVDYLLEARRIYNIVYEKYSCLNKEGLKFNPDNYNLQDLSSSMIFLSLASMMLKVDSKFYEEYYKHQLIAKKTILDKHYNSEVRALLENVNQNGKIDDSPKGRLVNPGHSLECAWFLFDLGDLSEIEFNKVIDIALWSYNLGWDQVNGGIKYFVDIYNQPLEQLEYDLKLWWPHSEALIIFLKLYLKTKNQKFYDIYQKIFDFSIKHFKIDELEWIGYLRYDNSVLNTSKGNLFKGPFHIPRMLIMNYLELTDYLKENNI